MRDDYLLTTEIARQLYHQIAEKLPIIDYHNHLSMEDFLNNRQYKDLTEIWIAPDPYKHRAMRICGVDEYYITGTADHKEKFIKWCDVFPKLMGNPLYDWSCMELEKIFGIEMPINLENAEVIWETANEKLKRPEFYAQGFLERFAVEYAAPCVSLCDDISVFKCNKHLVPSLRGDDLVNLKKETLIKLSTLSGVEIKDIDSLKRALKVRLDELDSAGCCFSDHALDAGFQYIPDDGEFEKRLFKLLSDGIFNEEDQKALASDMLRLLCQEYARRKWTLQLHIGAKRSTSTRLRGIAGTAGGYAGIGNSVCIESLVNMLNDFEQGKNGLPKTILYTLNPIDNAMLSVLSGSFVGVTQGPAWWFCDHLQGMREMLEYFSNYSVLYTFVGMNTDSRSLLSLLRHDYFRRMLCGWIGEKAVKNELPNDFEQLSELVKALCYQNAKRLINKGNENNV